MSEIMIWSPLERLFWGFVIELWIICGIIYYYRGMKREEKNEKNIMIGISFLFLGVALSRIFFFISDLQHTGILNNGIFFGELDSSNDIYNFLLKCAYISTLSGMVLFVFEFESTVKRTKYLLSYICSSFLLIIIFTPYSISNIVMNYVLPGFSVLILLSIIYMFTKWSALEFKAVSSLLFVAFIFFFMGIFLYNPIIKFLNVIPLYFSPIFLITGGLIALSPLLINPSHISRPSFFWLIIGIISIGMGALINIIILVYQLPIFYSVLAMFLLMMLIMVFFRIIKTIKIDVSEKKTNIGPNILAMFSKPQRVTEEEVTISKEKKTCLVCKSKLSRIMYICPECGSFMCDNCSKTLISIENACWVCETAIDESKPVKISQAPQELSKKELKKK